jgi:hypothetical protein
MKYTQKIADSMAPALKDELDKKGFIVSTIVIVSALVSIIVNLVKLSKLCKNDAKGALERIRKPGIIDKIKIRKAVRSSLKENSIDLPRGKKAEEGLVVIEKTISEICLGLSEKDVDFILEETEN